MPRGREERHPGRGGQRASLVLPEWVEAGLLGAFAVAIAYGVRDVAIGEPLHTASVLGVWLLDGAETAGRTVSAPGAAALYHGLHFALWMALGLAASRLIRRAEDGSGARWIPMACGAALLAAAFALDAVAPATPLARLHLGWGSAVGLAAMGGFLVWRHPGAIGR